MGGGRREVAETCEPSPKQLPDLGNYMQMKSRDKSTLTGSTLNHNPEIPWPPPANPNAQVSAPEGVTGIDRRLYLNVQPGPRGMVRVLFQGHCGQGKRVRYVISLLVRETE